MIVLDTCVLSELMRPAASEQVMRWVNGHPSSTLYVTSITHAEITYGILLLPRGRRRDAIAAAAAQMFASDFERRILAFGSDAAEAYAEIAARRRKRGRPIAAFDAQIAAISRISGAKLATRNVADFDDCGVNLVNPWTR